MPQVTCSRCFAIFEAEEGRPGLAPLCPACAPRVPAAALAGAPAGAAPRARRRRGRRAGALVLLAGVAIAVAGGAALVLRARAPGTPEVVPTGVQLVVEEWRAAGLVPAGGQDPGRAAARVAAGRAALAADLPARTAEALATFREAIALAPRSAGPAIAGYAVAFAEGAGDEPDGATLRVAHELVREAREAHRDDPALLAASARLLIVVPGEANAAEARALAGRAARAAPADPDARLALGLATLGQDAAQAARILEQAAEAHPADRRLLSAAARARWAAGDAAGALRHAAARLALDPGHPVALALRADVEIATERLAEARETLGRWEAAVPGSPLPPLLLARLAYQRDDDTALARRLLDVALAREPGAFTAARILAHRAAVELAAGNPAGAREAIDAALQRVPASAPARFQAALLAFRRGEAAALRESAGVLGDRAGPLAAQLLAARSAELSGTEEEAQEAYLAVAALAPRDPAVLLATAGALARLRASGPALQLARRALERDPLEGRLRRPPTDFWEGPDALAEAARRLEAIGRAEPAGSAVAFAAAAACELLLGRTVAAERLARDAAAASPQAAAPAVLLAQVALDRGQARAALAVARSLVEASPGDALPLAVHARALEALGRNQDAERAHRAAVEAGPDLAPPRLALARLLARRGEVAEAQALLDRLLADWPELSDARGSLLALADGATQPH